MLYCQYLSTGSLCTQISKYNTEITRIKYNVTCLNQNILYYQHQYSLDAIYTEPTEKDISEMMMRFNSHFE